MRKLLLPLLVLVFLFQPGHPVLAQNTGSAIAPPAAIMPFPAPPSVHLLGQDHRYSVTFRGNGDAVVSLRTVFANQEAEQLSRLTFRIPRVTPQDVIAFQVLQEPSVCLRYHTITTTKPTTPSNAPDGGLPACRSVVGLMATETGNAYRCLSPSGGIMYECLNGYTNTDFQCVPTKPETVQVTECAEYQEPDYYNYWGGRATYQKAEISPTADGVTVMLPRPVAPGKTGSIMLYYRGAGYARKDAAGAFSYSFETAKVEDRIQHLQIGINPDSDLILAGGRGSVEYRTEDVMTAAGMEGSLAAPLANAGMDRVYQQIGYGVITKSATDLQPLESYTVNGRYADSWFRLYWKWWLTGIAVVVLGLLLAGWLVRRLGNRLIRAVTGKEPAGKTRSTVLHTIVLTLVTSGLTAFLVVVYTIAFVIGMKTVEHAVPYDLQSLIVILGALISLGVYVFTVCVPGLVMGLKKGMAWGLATFGLTIVWLIGAFTLIIVFFILMRFTANYPIPALMRAAGSAVAEPAPAVDLPVPESLPSAGK